MCCKNRYDTCCLCICVYVCTLLLYVVVLLLLFDCRGTYFTCDPLVIDDVLHNVQSEWYALMLVLENLVMHVHFLCCC